MRKNKKVRNPKKTPEKSGPGVKKKKIASVVAKWLVRLFILVLVGSVLAISGAYYAYVHYSKDLPKISTLRDYSPPLVTAVYSDDGRKIAEFFKERRIVLPLSELPKNLIDAFIAAEDARYYHHPGVDIISIVRAFLKNLEAGSIVQGGSTITQQVIKYFLLTPEKKYDRKIKEAILAYRIDKDFTKDEVLYLYLNQIYLGHGAHGVGAAAENYFGKSVRDLNLAECALLAGLPRAPSQYSPYRHPEIAKKRQLYVLNRMVAEEYITPKMATEARNVKLDIKPRKNWFIEKVPFYTEHIRRHIEKEYGEEMLYTGGLQIQTAVNIEMQEAARRALDKGLRDLDKRQGYRGPGKQLALAEIEKFSQDLQKKLAKKPLAAGAIVEGIVIETNKRDKSVTVRIGDSRGVIPTKKMKWAKKPAAGISDEKAKKVRKGLAAGDLIHVKLEKKREKEDLWDLALEQTPVAQGAVLCLEAGTGHVKAMVGGRDFRETQFNRAFQSRRQPGSAFKPIVYAAALDKGFTPATEIIDNAIVFRDVVRNMKWKPKSFDRKFHGPTRLRVALAKSRNLAAIKILSDIGIDYAIEYAKKLGITSPLSRDLSIALGSSGVSLLELVKSYSVFCNQGMLVEPVFITKILDSKGKILYESQNESKQVIEKSTAFLMTSLLQSVVNEGTGQRVRKLNRPAAGKTGTTNNLYDALFVGFTPDYITGSWVGFDESRSLGPRETGSRAASPIWLGFMKAAHEGRPIRQFAEPEGVITCMIDADSGLLPNPESKNIISEKFKDGTEPKEQTPKYSPILEKNDFLDLFDADAGSVQYASAKRLGNQGLASDTSEDLEDLGDLELQDLWVNGTEAGTRPGREKTPGRAATPDNDFKIVGIRFFEAGSVKPHSSKRYYETQFPKADTRSVWTEVEIAANRPRPKRHGIEWIYHGPDGNEQGRMKWRFLLGQGEPSLTIERGWGWTEPGNWVPGTYRVEVRIDGNTVGEKRFNIY